MIRNINEIHIRVLYLLFGILNFVFSFFSMFFIDANIYKKIYGFVGLNLIYLGLYFFYRLIKNYKGIGNLAWPIFGGPMKFIFGMFSILAPFFLMYVFLMDSSDSDAKGLIFSFSIPVSFVLGGLSLLISLNEKS